ncbi:hypothetical protein QBZ16_000035 [Prototheca wickerhamii]|uniref:Transcription initiation factor TFIID subunit 12 domain-containing protein n=1 Tax=Prototheca wickerhamii TaxID=3111 RepID=A0AAD9IP19_PROWI|nr:hypothetical protein QBZ16_000035 [Prototheca wickerhamii]
MARTDKPGTGPGQPSGMMPHPGAPPGMPAQFAPFMMQQPHPGQPGAPGFPPGMLQARPPSGQEGSAPSRASSLGAPAGPSGRVTPTPGAAPGGLQPPTNFTLPTRQGNESVIRHMPIPQEFLREHPSEWPSWVADPAKHAMTIYQKFLQWAVARNTLHMQAAAAIQQRQHATQGGGAPALMAQAQAQQRAAPMTAPPAAKRPRVDAAAPPAALTPLAQAAAGALRPAAAGAASALQARLQDRGPAPRPNMPPIIKPSSEEDKSFLPRARAQKLIKDVCGAKVKPTPALVAALKLVAADFVSGAVAFGASLAKQRKSERLEATDLQLYFQRAWDIFVPGFGGTEVVPYRRPVASELHRARAAAPSAPRPPGDEAAKRPAEPAKEEDAGEPEAKPETKQPAAATPPPSHASPPEPAVGGDSPDTLGGLDDFPIDA